MVPLIVYLRFLATGELTCQEDGRHFRPNHHAHAAMSLEKNLRSLTTKNNAWLIRRLYPWLPSYDEAYRRSEPLTRIRDIAHRNDIPKELKNEIKHQLQNKLHRCAGPEDLVTSGEILQRITANHSQYSHDFVEQFKIFHQELEEFFNATALDQRLNGLNIIEPSKLSESIKKFSQLKANATLTGMRVIDLLRELTNLRRLIHLSQNEFSASSDSKNTKAQSQRLQMCDSALEDFSFSQFSIAINHFDKNKLDASWKNLLELSTLIVENTALSGIESDEAFVLVNEMNAWMDDISAKTGPTSQLRGDNSKHSTHSESLNPFELMRINASLQRATRLAETHSDKILKYFPSTVTKLGQALGVSEHAIRLYCEGDIRSNLVYQLSRLTELMRAKIDTALKLSPWETIVPGTGIGKLIHVKRMQEIEDFEALAAKSYIVWLDVAEGDENIPNNVRGVIVNHSIPHLSHLAVRARQLKIPFSVVRHPSSSRTKTLLEPLIGENVQIDIQTDNLNIKPVKETLASSMPASELNVPTKLIQNIPFEKFEKSTQVFSLEQAQAENCGGKVTGAQNLLRLAKSSQSLFSTPTSVALPFGFMLALLQKTPILYKTYQTLQEKLKSAPSGEIEPLIEKIRLTINKIHVPKDQLALIQKNFKHHDSLAIRSSSNCEDLDDFSGAGLHDSVLGVTQADIEGAIKQVWSSLWSRRAVLARRQANIPDHMAHMGILIQTMIHPQWSFIMHTENPYADKPHLKTMIAEIAVGLGETLASAQESGSPYRLCYEQKNKKMTILSMANFSFLLRCTERNGAEKTRIDYSNQPFSNNSEQLIKVAHSLGKMAQYLENKLGKAQDIEGCFANNTYYIVQTRAQQGL